MISSGLIGCIEISAEREDADMFSNNYLDFLHFLIYLFSMV